MKNFTLSFLALFLFALFATPCFAQENKTVLEFTKTTSAEAKSYEITGMSLTFLPDWYTEAETNASKDLYQEVFQLSFTFKRQLDAFLIGWIADASQTKNGKIRVTSNESNTTVVEYEFQNMKINSCYFGQYDHMDNSNDQFVVSVDGFKINGIEIKKKKKSGSK